MVASDQTILEFKGKRKWMWQRKLENCDFPTTVAIVQVSYEENDSKQDFEKYERVKMAEVNVFDLCW